MLKSFVLAAVALVLASCAHHAPSVYQLEADREGIKKAIQPHLKELRPCYEMAIDAYPGAEGKVMAEFGVGDDGFMKNLKFSEFDKTLEGGRICFTETMKKWKLPKPGADEDVTVKYPFFFSERYTFH